MNFIGTSAFETSGWFSPYATIEGWFDQELSGSAVVSIEEGYYRQRRRRRVKRVSPIEQLREYFRGQIVEGEIEPLTHDEDALWLLEVA